MDLTAAVRTEAPTTLAIAELDDAGTATYRFQTAGTSAPGLTDCRCQRSPGDGAERVPHRHAGPGPGAHRDVPGGGRRAAGRRDTAHGRPQLPADDHPGPGGVSRPAVADPRPRRRRQGERRRPGVPRPGDTCPRGGTRVGHGRRPSRAADRRRPGRLAGRGRLRGRTPGPAGRRRRHGGQRRRVRWRLPGLVDRAGAGSRRPGRSGRGRGGRDVRRSPSPASPASVPVPTRPPVPKPAGRHADATSGYPVAHATTLPPAPADLPGAHRAGLPGARCVRADGRLPDREPRESRLRRAGAPGDADRQGLPA